MAWICSKVKHNYIRWFMAFYYNYIILSTMDVTQKMKKAMTKDEVALLIDLIQSTPILTSKETNATTNKSKDDAWISLARTFNAKSGSVPKSKEQLKSKWDNLKKAARKRSQEIRMNNLKTGGGKPDFIPHDELLEKVTGLLGSTCTGFDVPFGGDGIGGGSVVLDVSGDAEVSVVDLDVVLHTPLNDATKAHNICNNIPEDNVSETPCRGIQAKRQKIDLWDSPGVKDSSKEQSTSASSKYFFGMPMSRQLTSTKKGKKKADSDIQASIITRNLAIANYYEKKTEKLNLEIALLKSQQKENNVTDNDIL